MDSIIFLIIFSAFFLDRLYRHTIKYSGGREHFVKIIQNSWQLFFLKQPGGERVKNDVNFLKNAI